MSNKQIDDLFAMSEEMFTMSRKMLMLATIKSVYEHFEGKPKKPQPYRGRGRPKGSINKPKSGYNPMNRSGNL